MSENVGNDNKGSPFFPLPPAAPSVAPRNVPLAIDPAGLRAMDPAALSAEILRILASVQGRPADEVARDPLAEDGTIALDSMTAVFLIATIGKALGRQRLVNLAKVDRDSLRSAGGLGRMAYEAIRSAPSVRVVA